MIKGEYSKWVSEADTDNYPGIEDTIRTLEVDPHCRDAASTLFWQIYFERYPSSTDQLTLLNSVDKVLDLLKAAAQPDDEVKLQSAAFVQMHLVTILLRAIRSHTWGSEELVRDFVNRGKTAFNLLDWHAHGALFYSSKMIQETLAERSSTTQSESDNSRDWRQAPIDYDEFQQRSCSVISSMFHLEAFYSAKEESKFEDALVHFSRGVRLWLEAMGESLENLGLSCEYNLHHAASCFEELRSSKSVVKSWQEISEACSIIEESLYIDEETVNQFVDLFDFQRIEWQATSYWTRAATISELEMHPDVFKQVLFDQITSQHTTRLKNDFFHGDWERLEEDTRGRLVDMEVSWYEAYKRGGQWAGSINDLRLAFEYELNRAVFMKTKIRRNLNLGAMADLLKKAGQGKDTAALAVKLAIQSDTRISVDDADFLMHEIPENLKQLWLDRNKVEHEKPTLTRKELEAIRNRFVGLRNAALGIGQPSQLRHIVSIKRSVQ